MMLLEISGAKILNIFLMFAQAQSSFGVYSVSQSLTPLGLVFVVVLPIVSILGIIYPVIRKLRKTKLK